jgi:hypothetical protein
MKRFLLILTLFFTSTTVVMAQEDEVEDRGGKLQERMQQYIQNKMNMNKQDAEKFAPIFIRYISELRRTHRENRGDRPVLQLRVAELRVKYRDELKRVFDEQRANRVLQHHKEFEVQVKKEILERRQQNRQQGGGRGRTQWVRDI